MAASNFNLRGISPEAMQLLKQEAKRLHISVNALILKMIEQGLGFAKKKVIYTELDHLAGTWSDDDAKAFEESTQFFEQIDETLW